ncbi:thioredoxin-related transmembrane protein 4 [Astyanax mexicanus]|uniref:Thioredoxin-related transmembrane protein 4 n=2 Tax=Astyanax mexicanus TaxID=7994 RepID=A0A8T2LAR9_ASTMX|nr:thioredoxin-related transmembrane protein 4 [Astyanax mexicanus]
MLSCGANASVYLKNRGSDALFPARWQIMCTGNMAGQSCARRLECGRNMLWLAVVFVILTVQLPKARAQAESRVVPVGDANWTLILEGEWMVKFYAPWCPACQHIQADWEALAKQSDSLGISVGKVDVTQQPGLSGRFLVTTLPTIFHAKDGSFRRYMSSRTIEDIQAYVVRKKWEAVEPLPGWKSPSSILMSGMAGLFRLSVWIRQIHTYLTDSLGIPSWGSYIIFAIITLFMGLVLGLMLVLIADCICPSRPKRSEEKPVMYAKDEGSEDEADDTVTEEKRTSDLENESERVSGEESTEEEGGPITEVAASSTDQPQAEGTTDSSLRKRKPQGPNSPEGT